jgi:hypothetical protein
VNLASHVHSMVAVGLAREGTGREDCWGPSTLRRRRVVVASGLVVGVVGCMITGVVAVGAVAEVGVDSARRQGAVAGMGLGRRLS